MLNTSPTFFIRINSLDNAIVLKAARGLHSRTDIVVILNVVKVDELVSRDIFGTLVKIFKG